MKYTYKLFILLLCLLIPMTSYAFRPDQGDGWGPTAASNVDSVKNTRHNLTVEYASMRGFMADKFNFYGEVCVYCHTPHGANATVQSTPLWNRPTQSTSYTLYAGAMASNQTVSEPGPASITCLSCHDGTLAIDAIINQPGASRYDSTLQAADAFLDEWAGTEHQKMGDCAYCHNETGMGLSIPNFFAYIMGDDLRDDHPVGVQLPSHMDFRVLTGEIPGKMRFFDTNGNDKPDKNEIRLYYSGGTYEVECASCHDPHGVMNPDGDTFNSGFLRINNAGSAVCFSCHVK